MSLNIGLLGEGGGGGGGAITYMVLSEWLDNFSDAEFQVGQVIFLCLYQLGNNFGPLFHLPSLELNWVLHWWGWSWRCNARCHLLCIQNTTYQQMLTNSDIILIITLLLEYTIISRLIYLNHCTQGKPALIVSQNWHKWFSNLVCHKSLIGGDLNAEMPTNPKMGYQVPSGELTKYSWPLSNKVYER